ncbi:MAG: hypothetical protein GC159_13730 [Phycisphaera sp.]|nr:hypothetical protein [Phycisphaera sp.]
MTCLLGSLCAPIRADEATDTFNQLFGDEVRRVTATRVPDDDVALARSIISAADSVEDKPALVRVLLDNAQRLAAKDPSGYDTAILALERLAERVPDAAADANDQLVTLLMRRYSAARGDDRAAVAAETLAKIEAIADGQLTSGDSKSALALYKRLVPLAAITGADDKERVRNKTLEAAQQQRVDTEIELLKGRLKASPGDKSIGGDLIKTLVVEKDDPAEARKYSFLTDEATGKLIRAATRDTSELDADTAVALGKWYYELSRDARAGAKLAMLNHADAAYQRFLELAAADLQATQAKLMVARIADEIEKLNAQNVTTAKPTSRQPNIVFHADKSMQLFPVGTTQGGFPAQETDDGRGPFLGKGVYFNQMTGKDVYYELSLPRPAKQVYWKGAAMQGMTITILDKRGKELASTGPHGGGNNWGEFTLDVPRTAGTRFVLRFHNEVSHWYYINKIELR